MYFWKIENLKKDLIKGSLSENESFMYLMATLIIYGFSTIPLLDSTMWDVYAGLVGFVLQIIGAYYVYKCNKGSSGNNFLQKYLSIGWVLGIRWLIMVLIPFVAVYIVCGWLAAVMYDVDILQYDFLNLFILSLFSISYYWLFGKHMKDVAKQA